MRDWDVFTLDLLTRRNEAAPAEQGGLDYLLGYAAGQRSAAQAHLQEIGADDGERFQAFFHETLKAVHPHKHEGVLGELAAPLLTQLQHALETKANGDLTNYEHLHQVRIAGKRLRYAMELFAECFDATFKDTLYPQIEEMQEILGHLRQ